MVVRHLVVLPGVPGPDLAHRNKSTADREVANARKAGLDVEVREVLTVR